MRGSIVILATSALFLWPAAPARAQSTIHVAVTGSDTPTCGASTAPCKTVQAGLDRAAAGDTVVVGGGRTTSA